MENNNTIHNYQLQLTINIGLLQLNKPLMRSHLHKATDRMQKAYYKCYTKLSNKESH